MKLKTIIAELKKIPGRYEALYKNVTDAAYERGLKKYQPMQPEPRRGYFFNGDAGHYLQRGLVDINKRGRELWHKYKGPSQATPIIYR